MRPLALTVVAALAFAHGTSSAVEIPELVAPAPGSTLTGNQIRFHWDTDLEDANEWWLRVGSSDIVGASDYFDSGRLSSGASPDIQVTLPGNSTDTVYATLYYKIHGVWYNHVYLFDRNFEPSSNQLVDTTASNSVLSTNQASNWSMSVDAPDLVDPLIYELSVGDTLTHIDDFDKVGCEGHIHRIDIPWNRDAIVTMNHDNGPLTHPIWVVGGNNVHIKGIELIPKVQNGCGIGQAHQYRAPQFPNIHPRIPGSKAIRFQQKGATFLEGIDIDLLGQEADCFVSRNYSESTPQYVKANRDISIVNSRCAGIEGLDRTAIGDGVHGDFFQNQGEDVGSLTIENVTFRTSSNGITLQQWNGSAYLPRFVKLRNLDYGWDERYAYDDDYETSGLPFIVQADEIHIENVWLDHGKGGNYGFINGERIGAISHPNYIERHPSMFPGLAPLGEFAPSNKTGKEYQSPY